MAPLLVVGLGNPGPQYRETRHNAGFQVLEELARRLRVRPREGRGDYQRAVAEAGPRAAVLVWPLTFMNGSGSAVADALWEFGASPEELLVVVDDLWLPLGAIRLRPGGSDGGHRGLASIIQCLGTGAFPRLRCGIRPGTAPPREQVPEFVLSPFEEGERPTAAAMVRRAADAVGAVLAGGLDRAMSVYNG